MNSSRDSLIRSKTENEGVLSSRSSSRRVDRAMSRFPRFFDPGPPTEPTITLLFPKAPIGVTDPPHVLRRARRVPDLEEPVFQEQAAPVEKAAVPPPARGGDQGDRLRRGSEGQPALARGVVDREAPRGRAPQEKKGVPVVDQEVGDAVAQHGVQVPGLREVEDGSRGLPAPAVTALQGADLALQAVHVEHPEGALPHRHRGGGELARNLDREQPLRLAPASAVDALLQAEARSEEHTSELQSQFHLVCRLLLEKK